MMPCSCQALNSSCDLACSRVAAPGARQFTVTPVPAVSVASALVMEITPPMAAANAGWPRSPSAPCEVVFTTRPQPWAAISGTAWRAMYHFWDICNAMVLWYSSGAIS